MWKVKAFKYRTITNFTQWLAHKLPARLRYFAAIDVVAYATTGQHSNTVVPDLTAMEAIKRFEKGKNIK